MVGRLLNAMILTVALPFFVSVVVYFGFGTNYTGGVFHEAGFRKQYESGIYRYRILGRDLLLQTHGFVTSENPVAGRLRWLFARPPASVGFLDPRVDATFYAAYFLQNTFFLVLACGLLYSILMLGTGTDPPSVPLLVAVLLMGLTQYVVSPYDTLFYALLLLSFLLILRPFRFSVPLLALLMVVSTLARESSALTLSFFFARHHDRLLGFRRKEVVQLAVLTAAFAVTYASLRLWLGFDHAVWQNLDLSRNLTSFHSLAGIAALPVVSYALCRGSRHLKSCLLFLAACSPYLVAMLVVASPWEMRLWVPVWLGLICLTNGVPDSEVPASGHSGPA
jgi:hypothetical protein